MGNQFFNEEPKHITYRPTSGAPQTGFELNGQWIGPAPEYDSGFFEPELAPDIGQEMPFDESRQPEQARFVDPQQVPTPVQFNRPAQNPPKKNNFIPVFFVMVAAAVVLMGPLSSLVSSFLDSINDDEYENSSFAGGTGDDFGLDSYYTSTDFMNTDPEDPEIVESFDKRFELAIADEDEMRTLVDFEGYWTTELLGDVEDSSMFTQYDFGVLTETLERENPYQVLLSETVVFAMASGLLDPEVDSDYLSQFLLAFSLYGNLPGQELKGGDLLASKKLLDGVKKSEYKVLLDEYFVEVPYEDTQLESLAEVPDSDSEQNRELRALLLWDMLIELGLASYEY